MKKRYSVLGLGAITILGITPFLTSSVWGNEPLATPTKTGLVQLWQVVPSGQTSEGATTKQIMNALQCRPNHDLNPIAGGKSQHATYVNSCYVDDAMYLGEDSSSYHIYLAGYEGKVAKKKSHYFDLDLNGDGRKVKYEIQTVAYFIPDGQVSLQSDSFEVNQSLNYVTDHLVKEATEVPASESIPFSRARLIENNWEALASDGSPKVTGTVVSPSYYANESGTLVHYLSNNVRGTTYSKTTIGKAPTWMKANTRYYSYDNIYFYTNWRNVRVDGKGAVNATNPFYNYYQYLPFRTTSNLSINQINSFTKSYGYQDLPTKYPASANQSQLVNTGKYFMAVQNKYGINGALQYAMGIHESGWGRSSLSIQKNNLFGMNATDNNPYGNGTSFETIEKGINYHADCYVSQGYTDPVSDRRYFGSHVGNKGSGMNVKYASDPFWGEKIAGWYYRLDSANGLKDHNYYSIGIKQNTVKYPVKTTTTQTTPLYETYNQKSNLTIADYPMVLIGTKGDFYQVKSDTPVVQGVASYSGQYKWTETNAYVSKTAIQVKNHSTYRVPGLSSDSTLKTLTTDKGIWSTPFTSKTKTYTVKLDKYASEITFKGAPTHSEAKVISGLGTHPLAPESETVIPIKVQAADGTTTTYKVTVINPRQSNNAMFKLITSNVGTWDQPFTPKVTKYRITLPKYQESITLDGKLADATATYVGGLGTHKLAPESETMIKVQSRSQKGTLLTYQLTVVNPRQSNNAMFKTLKSNVGTWDQPFTSKVTKYRITLPKYQESITLSGTLADATATYVGGLGTHQLAPESETMIKVQSRSQKGTLLTYQLTVVNPRQSNNAMFKTLTSNVGTWNQPYDPRTTTYTITLPKYQESITLSGTLADATATYVGGLGTHKLEPESNTTINVQSRSQKGTLLTYTINVVNPRQSNNAMFKTLTSNVGTWNQPFDRRTLSYTITLPTYQTRLTIKGTLADSTATIIGGIGTHTLKEGDNVIKVQSRSQKGTLLTYELKVVNPKKK